MRYPVYTIASARGKQVVIQLLLPVLDEPRTVIPPTLPVDRLAHDLEVFAPALVQVGSLEEIA